MAEFLRNQFVFYLFPILNPDGVRRGHFRVDTNGINLNRCYINPSAKAQPSIYAVRKTVLSCYNRGNYFAFLDLHAQASRTGNFIYGNSLNELSKQVQACLFPKILSLNSENF
jgi:murein tripeptide amidase MpaA